MKIMYICSTPVLVKILHGIPNTSWPCSSCGFNMSAELQAQPHTCSFQAHALQGEARSTDETIHQNVIP